MCFKSIMCMYLFLFHNDYILSDNNSFFIIINTKIALYYCLLTENKLLILTTCLAALAWQCKSRIQVWFWILCSGKHVQNPIDLGTRIRFLGVSSLFFKESSLQCQISHIIPYKEGNSFKFSKNSTEKDSDLFCIADSKWSCINIWMLP